MESNEIKKERVKYNQNHLISSNFTAIELLGSFYLSYQVIGIIFAWYSLFIVSKFT